MIQYLQKTKTFSLVIAFIILFTSCTSTTRILSEPSGAIVYLDGEKVGTTPYSMTDTKVIGTCTHVALVKEGYEEFCTVICRNEEVDPGAVIGGILVLFPFLWTMKYKPTHNYELIPFYAEEPIYEEEYFYPEENYVSSKAERILEMKQLYDDGILTQEEFEAEKKKILDEEE